MLHSIWLQILGGIPMVPDASLCYDKSRTEKKEVPPVSRPPMDPARFRQEMVPQFLTALLLVFPLYNGLLWPFLFESSYTGMVLYEDSASRDAVAQWVDGLGLDLSAPAENAPAEAPEDAAMEVTMTASTVPTAVIPTELR